VRRLAILGALKISEYIRQNFEEKEYAEFDSLLAQNMDAEEIQQTEAEVFREVAGEDENLAAVLGRCGGNEVAITLLELCILRYVNQEYVRLLEMISPGNGKGVSLNAAARVAESVSENEDCANPVYIMKAGRRLELLLMVSQSDTDMMRGVFACDATLAAFLYGNVSGEDVASGEILDRILRDDCSIYDSDIEKEQRLFGYEESASLFARTADGLEKSSSDYICVVISGEPGSGRLAHARFLEKGGRRMLVTDYSFLTGEGTTPLRLASILRLCVLYGLDLCVKDIEKDENTIFFTRRIQEQFGRYVGRGRLYLLTDENVKLVPFMKCMYCCHEIERPIGERAKALWSGMLGDCGLTGYDAEELSSVLTMNAGQLKGVVGRMAELEALSGERISREKIYRMCYEALDDGRYENVKRVEPGYSLEDLKIDVRKKAVLREICNQVRYRNKVYEKWGMSEKYAYGRCVSILLAGPPGTGKTMAVHALAKELGLEMYKVDLSQVVDKYIGETEKRLEEVFAKAERSNMILFFDEADAVMGKRTDTNDAHDKSANTQIAFILQRMESYDGIVVLATNLMMNIDKAFMRRIRYVLQFEYPSPEVRYDIWKSAFAKGVPVSPEVDFGFLAESFEVSGAVIKNIVLNATFYAAADDTAVTMEHIMQAVFREEAKDHGIIGSADLSRYEYLK